MRIHVGPAGWSYPDWEKRVYPAAATTGFDRLGWIARFFDVVEVNASFYRVPPAATAASWVQRVADRSGFHFTVKLHQSLTHARTVDPATVNAMLAFIRPLEEAGALGALLAQFPWSFRADDAGFAHLEGLRTALGDRTVALEVRHGGWGGAAPRARVAELGYALVSVDQPQIGDSLRPVAWLTGDTAYVRLHGRNTAAWFAKDAGRDARYDYLYTDGELTEWARRIVPLAERARTTYVITNNHFEGKAIANALQLRALLGQPVDEVPAELDRAYPRLVEGLRLRGARAVPIAPAHPAPGAPEPGGTGQGTLFA